MSVHDRGGSSSLLARRGSESFSRRFPSERRRTRTNHSSKNQYINLEKSEEAYVGSLRALTRLARLREGGEEAKGIGEEQGTRGGGKMG